MAVVPVKKDCHPQYRGCCHLAELKEKDGVDSYETIISSLVSCTSEEMRKVKALTSICSICSSYSGRIHACLQCIFFGCYRKKHIHSHFQGSGHYLGVELLYGNVFCFHCDNYVYDKQLMDITRKHARNASKSLGMRDPFESWQPDYEEMILLKSNRKRLRITPNSTIGLRGLINLGSTCFMNCIIQTLTHTPLLRDYFLAEKHHCPPDPENTCVVCEITRLFQEFYSGKRQPLILHRLLHLIWMHAHHLAGFEQHDAHEFFISTLDVLHRHFFRDSGGSTDPSNPHHCNCIIDRIFTGGLQSDVVCLKCHGVSTTIDPFWDISLDLYDGSDAPPTTLLECLERYTRQEHLGSTGKINCNQCDTYEESTKQLTMKTLPIVICFHLKRFEHSSKNHRKISTHVSFPEFLDLTPFMSYMRSRTPNGIRPQHQVSSSDNLYYLFAVVNHIGGIRGGHYVVYIRQHQDQWFKCNDELITCANISQVLNTEGYLLFYHKRILEYE